MQKDPHTHTCTHTHTEHLCGYKPLSTPGKDPVLIVQAGWAPGLVWTDAENFARTGIRSPDHPARSQLLFRLSYPAHLQLFVKLIKSIDFTDVQ
jgi:hypothetical protein